MAKGQSKRPNVTELATTPVYMRYLWVATVNSEDGYYYSTGTIWIRLRNIIRDELIVGLKFIDLVDDKVYVVATKSKEELEQFMEDWRDAYFDRDGFDLKPYMLNS